MLPDSKSPLSVWVMALICTIILISTAESTEIKKTTYHGWNEAFVMTNGKVEAVVIPQIGRVMQFMFAGDAEGPFWENRVLDGKATDSQSSEWVNFGGDKTWPAPQAEWAKMTGRGWPPPKAFDSMGVKAKVAGDSLILTSAVDPSYGIETERKITLATSSAGMEIQTTYRKVEGSPVRVSIWVITQLNDPAKLFMLVPKATAFPNGYNKQSEALPLNLDYKGQMVSCTRSPIVSTKIGSDASRLLWADNRVLLEIHSPRESAGEFPDQGSSAEIYTNPDPNKYIELETLGPLHTLSVGQSISRSQMYRLFRRDKTELRKQVENILEDMGVRE